MNLINKDFVSPTERITERINDYMFVKNSSPYHIAKIYLAAEKEALNNIRETGEIFNESVLNSEMVKVLCRYIASN